MEGRLWDTRVIPQKGKGEILTHVRNYPMISQPFVPNFYLYYSNKLIVVTKSYKYYFVQTSGSNPLEWNMKVPIPLSPTEIKGRKR